ncbi:hypothetical protein [Marinicellulosiphila megalodicopiae]|uniref:hypothetical protein n=1 Tax=Marinicellulosiphila megalodicopiae TaxID=2724896 RepID=UPI003BAE2B5E
MWGFILLHVGTGILAMLFGLISLVSTKGSKRHIQFGKGYVGLMLVSAILGMVYALIVPNQILTFFAGLLTAYLLITSFMAFRKNNQPFKNLDLLLILSVWGCALCLISLAVVAFKSPNQMVYGYDFSAYAFIGGIALIAGIFDLIRLSGRLQTRKHNITRHLWRMGFTYFVAVGSFFTGQGAKYFPEYLQDSGWLELPELLVVACIVYFSLRVWIAKRVF